MEIKVGDWVKYHIPFGESSVGEVLEAAPHYILVNIDGIHAKYRRVLEPSHILEVRPTPET